MGIPPAISMKIPLVTPLGIHVTINLDPLWKFLENFSAHHLHHHFSTLKVSSVIHSKTAYFFWNASSNPFENTFGNVLVIRLFGNAYRNFYVILIRIFASAIPLKFS